MLRVAKWAKMIRPRATIHVTTMELVMGNPRRRPTSTALWGRPCASGSAGECSAWADCAGKVVATSRRASAEHSRVANRLTRARDSRKANSAPLEAAPVGIIGILRVCLLSAWRTVVHYTANGVAGPFIYANAAGAALKASLLA